MKVIHQDRKTTMATFVDNIIILTQNTTEEAINKLQNVIKQVNPVKNTELNCIRKNYSVSLTRK